MMGLGMEQYVYVRQGQWYAGMYMQVACMHTQVDASVIDNSNTVTPEPAGYFRGLKLYALDYDIGDDEIKCL